MPPRFQMANQQAAAEERTPGWNLGGAGLQTLNVMTKTQAVGGNGCSPPPPQVACLLAGLTPLFSCCSSCQGKPWQWQQEKRLFTPLSGLPLGTAAAGETPGGGSGRNGCPPPPSSFRLSGAKTTFLLLLPAGKTQRVAAGETAIRPSPSGLLLSGANTTFSRCHHREKPWRWQWEEWLLASPSSLPLSRAETTFFLLLLLG